MATITSAQTGNWSETSTWVGGVVPGDGDIAVRVANHVITVDQNTTIGDDSGNDVLACYGPASGTDSGGFVISAGIALTLKGSFRTGGTGAYLTLNAGAKVVIATNYNGFIGIGSTTNVYGTLTTNGTAESWCEIDASGSSGSWYLRAGSGAYYCEIFEGSYCYLKNIYQTTYGRGMTVDHWIWDSDCGDINPVIALSGSRNFDMQYCTHQNPSANFYISVGSASTGDRVCKGNVFICTAYLWSFNDLDFEDCIFLGGFSYNNDEKGAFDGCFFSTGGVLGVKTQNYVDSFIYRVSTTNPHFIQQGSGTALTVDGCVFEHGGSDGNGDCVMPYSSASSTLVVKNSIVLPGTTGNPSGTLISLLGDASTYATIFNNTTRGWITVGETYAGHAGMVPNSFNNMFYGIGASTPTHEFLTNTDDVFTNCDHNSAFGVTTPYENNPDGYDSAPGSNDVNTDPDFYESTRDLASWAADELGSVGATEADRRQDAIDALAASNDTSDGNYHVSATPSNLVSYILVGFTAQNTTDYLTAGEGGSYPDYIGAVLPQNLTPADDDGNVLNNVTSNVTTNVKENLR